jgi:hypothetical protein
MRMSNLSMRRRWNAKTPPHFRVTGFSTHGVTSCRSIYAFAEVEAAGAGIVGAAPIGP